MTMRRFNALQHRTVPENFDATDEKREALGFST